jgi:exonuclease SbcC
MLITKLELEEIKSHENSVFEFQPGITAITGANGAGKTTIIEAIAWALFDFLEYNRDDFARRGAKKGAVRVTFQSDLDQKFYTVIRETTGKHAVFDKESNAIIHQQNAAVMNFLRRHWQVEPGTSLKELYRAAVGVPQGTFTAVFLDNANTRKAVFDRLLKVEEYREGAKKLGETVNLIKEKQSAVRLRLAVAESQLKQFDETEAENRQIQAEIGELEKVLANLRGEIEMRSSAVNEFEAARTKLETARSVLRENQTAAQNARVHQQAVQIERDAAQAAARRTSELAADYQIFVQAEQTRAKLERERDKRDCLRAEDAKIERNLINAKAELQSLEKDLRRAAEAAQNAEKLSPLADEQEKLEIEYKTLLETRAEIRAAANRAEELEPKIAAKRAEWRKISDEIKDAMRGETALETIEQLEIKLKTVSENLAAAEKALTTLDLLRPQQQAEETELEKSAQNLRRVEKEIAALEKFSFQARQVGELSEKEIVLNQKIADLRAMIEWNAKFQTQAKKGVCPILPDKCLNLREGEQLAAYLTDQFLNNRDALESLETERSQIVVALKSAREAEKNVIKLPTLNEQAATLRLQIAERAANLEKIKSEIAALAEFSAKTREDLRREKNEIEEELKSLEAAARKFAAVEGLRRQIENLKAEGVKLGEEQKVSREQAAKIGETEAKIVDNQNRLKELDDPKGRIKNYLQEAARETELQTRIGEIVEQIKKLESEKLRLDEQLTKFAALDEKLADVRATLEQKQASRDEYLQNEATARRLPELETKLSELNSQVQRLKAAVEAAERDFAEAEKKYNADKHATEKSSLEAARTAEAGNSATLSAKKLRENQLKEILARLTEVREKMQSDLLEQENLRRTFETTDYIRETLKKAAPHVGEILRYEIAREATVMFREITNEVGRSLKWTDDYEILLDENGYQRPFANLSGGEQMAAALSIRLSLLTQLSDIKIAFFDEPTTNLDRERRERLAQQIGQIRNFKQLFVISHDDTFESNADHQIVVGNLAE